MLEPSDRLALESWQSGERSLADLDDHEFEAAIRETRRQFVERLNAALVFILSHPFPQTAGWAVAYAMGLPVCEGVSMQRRTKAMGLKRATLSKNTRIFQRGNQLPMNEYMRDSAASCANARTRQLAA